MIPHLEVLLRRIYISAISHSDYSTLVSVRRISFVVQIITQFRIDLMAITAAQSRTSFRIQFVCFYAKTYDCHFDSLNNSLILCLVFFLIVIAGWLGCYLIVLAILK